MPIFNFSQSAAPAGRTAVLALLMGLILAGCATPANYYDPLEPMNRKIYRFNKVVDDNVMKPVVKGYQTVTPKPVQTAVSNVFSNFEDIYVSFNSYLQGKFVDGTTDAFRFVINSTFGIGGLFDIASAAHLPKHHSDFGQTLGKWGVGSGPFIVAPFFGPKTLRDSSDWLVGYEMDASQLIKNTATRNELFLVRMIDQRSQLSTSDAVLGTAAVDEYAFVRNGYLQRRYGMIYDGDPPKPLKLGEDDDIDVTSSDFNDSKPADKPATPAKTDPKLIPVAPQTAPQTDKHDPEIKPNDILK